MKKKAYIDISKTKVYKGKDFYDVEYSKLVKRRSYAKIDRQVEVPNLVAYQHNSYEEFLTEGIRSVCQSIFPIIDSKRSLEVHYKGHFFQSNDYNDEDVLIQNKNLDVRFFLELQVIWNKVDRLDKEKPPTRILLNPIPPKKRKKTKQSGDEYTYTNKFYFGNIPIFSSRGNFIINGTNKIIIPQILKTPGAYFVKDKIGNFTYWVGRIQPFKGNWLDIAMRHDFRHTVYPLYIHFDRSKKGKAIRRQRMPVTEFLRALGLTMQMQNKIFNSDKYIQKTFEQEPEADNLYSALCSLDSLISRISTKTTKIEDKILLLITSIKNVLFSSKRYSLKDFGRYQLNQKLNIFKRLMGTYIYDDLKTNTGKVLLPAGTLIDSKNIRLLINERENLDVEKTLSIKDGIFADTKIQFATLRVYTNEFKKDETSFTIIGPVPGLKRENLEFDIVDVLSIVSFLLGLERVRSDHLVDDIDHLENRRVRNIGELTQEQFNEGMLSIQRVLSKRLSINITYDQLLQYEKKGKRGEGRENFFAYFFGILDPKPLELALKKFFNTSQLVQYMDQINPVAELANKRKITSLGPSGLDRRWSGEKVRDVHITHYGRICPVETPEGANIGLIHSLPTFTILDKLGFLKTPYWVVKNGKLPDLTDKNAIVYLSPHEEYSNDYIIASSNTRINVDGEIINDTLFARKRGENIIAKKENITHLGVSPRQVLSISASCIPFIENDDASRVLMASNMQRQAVPLLIPESPIIGTGMEYVIARDSAVVILAKISGVVDFADATKIIISDGDNKVIHELSVFENSNQGTSTRHYPLVKKGDKVKKGDIIADGSATEKGELALGRNVLVALSTWYGYNFEDAVVISSRLVKDDVFTSVHVVEYTIECHETKSGKEEFTRDLPFTSDLETANLDENGIVTVGIEVKEGDILVGKTAPQTKSELTPQQELVFALFEQKPRNIKNVSLRVPNGVTGIVQKAIYLKRDDGSGNIIAKTKTKSKWSSSYTYEGVELKDNVTAVIKVYLIQKRKIQEGDKVAGRHGNKGVISIIVPEEDMPYLEDGTPIDILLSPLGIPSRMNIGQILELHAGYAAKKLGLKVATPVFEGMNAEDVDNLLKEAELDPVGKFNLYNGFTGEKFKEKVSVGIMYIMKLAHMIDDKIHARSIGPYSVITQQPLGGKANNGGQRLGEMEVWALEAYGAAYTLKEMLTLKSDDIFGRRRAYGNIIDGKEIDSSGIPEALSVLVNELRALGISTKLRQEERVWKLKDSDYTQFSTLMGKERLISDNNPNAKELNEDNTDNEEKKGGEDGE